MIQKSFGGEGCYTYRWTLSGAMQFASVAGKSWPCWLEIMHFCFIYLSIKIMCCPSPWEGNPGQLYGGGSTAVTWMCCKGTFRALFKHLRANLFSCLKTCFGNKFIGSFSLVFLLHFFSSSSPPLLLPVMFRLNNLRFQIIFGWNGITKRIFIFLIAYK